MTSDRIHEQLMRKVDNNEIEIVGSSVLLFEVSIIPDDLKRISVEKLIARVATEIGPVTASTKGLAGQIVNSCGVGAMDAMHLAIAVECGAQVFLTTDDAVLSSADRISAYRNGALSENQVIYHRGERGVLRPCSTLYVPLHTLRA